MILQSGHDLVTLFRSFLHDDGGPRALVAAYFTIDMQLVGLVRMPDDGDHGECPERHLDPSVDEFDDDLTPFRDAILAHGPGLPFVALAFHGDPAAMRGGRRPPWQRSLDELVIGLAERETVLLAHAVFDDDECTVWSSIGYGAFAGLPGLECMPIRIVQHYEDEDQLFLDRVRCDAIAARERLDSARPRGAAFGIVP